VGGGGGWRAGGGGGGPVAAKAGQFLLVVLECLRGEEFDDECGPLMREAVDAASSVGYSWVVSFLSRSQELKS
jgi:hypothetical protein